MERRLLEDRGQSLVEFALSFPLALLMALIGVQLVLLMGEKMAIENAAFDAVRSAAVRFEKNPSEARLTAEAIVFDRTGMLPMGPGFMKRPVKVVALKRDGDEVHLTVSGTAELLPFIAQAASALGLKGAVELGTTASAKAEPFTGE